MARPKLATVITILATLVVILAGTTAEFTLARHGQRAQIAYDQRHMHILNDQPLRVDYHRGSRA